MAKNESGLKFVLRALRYRNYRLFFGGQGISLVGTWMQQIAVIWLVYRMTGSTLLLGIVGFASQIPAFLLTPFAGVFVDRWDRYKILLVSQMLAMVQAFALAFLFATGYIAVWHIVALSVLLGLISAFEIPSRHAFVFDIVDKKEDIANAIALNSTIFNAARLIGPFIAGLIIAAKGEGVCFFVNAASYLAVIISLLAMKITYKRKDGKGQSVLKGLKEGVKYAFGLAPIKYILILVAIMSLFGMPYAILMPAFATDILQGGPRAFGFLMAASGAGAFLGALYLASRRSVVGLGRKLVLAGSVFGLGLILFSQSHVLWLCMPLIFFVGMGMMVQMAGSNTVLQTIVEDNMRGRVMSLYTTAFIGTVPFGSLLIGGLAQKIGAPRTLFLCGIFCILGAAFFASKLGKIRAAIRPIYRKKGILPAETPVVQTPAELMIPPED